MNKDSKDKVTAWVKKSTLALIRNQADQTNSTVSEVVNVLLARAITMKPEDIAPSMPTVQDVRQAVRNEIKIYLEHLETLCTRTALDSDAARREQFQILSKQFGAETATRIRRTATAEARSNLERIRHKPNTGGTNP